MAPIKAVAEINKTSDEKAEVVKQIIIIMGATFWGINNNHKLNHEIEFDTETNQPCKGAAPIFKDRAKHRVFLIVFRLLDRKVIDDKIKTEAIAWLIKYFKEASLWYLLFLENNKGIKSSKLISKNNHIISQESTEIIIKIVKKRRLKNKIIEGCKKIIYFGVKST